jgi:hypothetical protein
MDLHEDKFDKWMSRVELWLQQMVKKTSYELPEYDYHQDFTDDVPPQVTAARAIREAYSY